MTQTTTEIYRIFLSSTAIDMQKHRKQVSDAIMRLGDLPVGMETFGAQPSEPIEVCQDKVRQCDALVVMVAHRYGWVPTADEGGDDHKSITWIEVETAIAAGKPVFAFLVDQSYGWTEPKEQDLLVDAKTPEAIGKVVKSVTALQDFKSFLEREAGLTRDKFDTPKDLALKVATSLSNWAKAPRSASAKAPQIRTSIFREVHPLQPAPHFRGRTELLAGLHEWWNDPVHPDRVRALVAMGGAGKTATIQHFLRTIRKDKLRGSVLVWSFYEEPNTDAFLAEACVVFAGSEGDGIAGRLGRLQRALSGGEPHLLVLDGLEMVQSVGGAGRAKGDLEDYRLKNLLRAIAGGLGATCALITSRFKLTDLEPWDGSGYLGTQLDELDEETAVSVLQAWEIRGEEQQLKGLAKSVGNHALSVSVLGSYLNRFCGGDPKGAEEFNLEEAAEDETQAARLARVLAGYAINLPADEKDLLVRLSIFPSGVSVELMGYVIDAGGDVAGALVGYQERTLVRIAERLCKQGLIFTYQRRNALTYTAHPFLREYFRGLLGVPALDIHEAVRSKLAVGLDSKPDSKPVETQLLDRYEALIEHSILAGRFKEAYDLFEGVMGGKGGVAHLYNILCDYGRMIRIISLFAEAGDPVCFTLELATDSRGALLNWWGLAAYELGDFTIAQCCFDLSFGIAQQNGEPATLSQVLQNSACISMQCGSFPQAQKQLKEAIEYADADNKYVNANNSAFLASTYHLLGETQKAQLRFAEAMEIEGEPLYALTGFYEAEQFFCIGAQKSVYQRTVANLRDSHRYKWPNITAFCHSLLGHHCLSDSLIEARYHLKKIRDWAEQSGHMECIIRAHILAAAISYCAGNLADALLEATTGLNHAEGCGYGQFAIDLLLQLAKINLAIPEPRKALCYARKALDRSEHPKCQYAWGIANGLHLCGICHKALGERDLAKKRFEAALEIRLKIQHPEAQETRVLLEEYV
ncbi:MAG: DUF4062 domain-containing protein [Algicola sp.]|nr:DUF4062 domain-containing protein [Algicola sp.]